MQCFKVTFNEIDGRLDVDFYKPEFSEVQKILNKQFFKKIKDICFEIKNGSTPEGGKFEKEGIPYFRSQDFKMFDINLKQYITKEFHEKLSRSAIEPKDTLLAVVGATLGVVGFVPNQIKEANINQNVARIRVKDSNVIPEYFAIFLNSNLGQKQIFQQATITTQAYLNNSQLGEIKIPIPPVETQNKIVEIMQTAYAGKKQKEQEAKRLLDSIDDFVLEQLGIKLPEVQDKMCFAVRAEELEGNRHDSYYYQPKFEKLEKAVKNGKYDIIKLKKHILKIHYGASLKNNYVEEGIKFLRILNLKPNFIDVSKVVNLPDESIKEIGNAFVKTGDLLISRSGTVGMVSVIPKEANNFAFGSFMIKFCLDDNINKEYASIWLNNKISKIFFEREKIGAIQGNITISTIENFIIPSPAIEEQNKIVNEFNARTQTAKQLQKEAQEELQQAKARVERMILGEEI